MKTSLESEWLRHGCTTFWKLSSFLTNQSALIGWHAKLEWVFMLEKLAYDTGRVMYFRFRNSMTGAKCLNRHWRDSKMPLSKLFKRENLQVNQKVNIRFIYLLNSSSTSGIWNLRCGIIHLCFVSEITERK